MKNKVLKTVTADDLKPYIPYSQETDMVEMLRELLRRADLIFKQNDEILYDLDRLEESISDLSIKWEK